MSSCNDDDVIAVTLDQLVAVFHKPPSTLHSPFASPSISLSTYTHMVHANWLKLLLDTRLVAFSPSIFEFPSSP